MVNHLVEFKFSFFIVFKNQVGFLLQISGHVDSVALHRKLLLQIGDFIVQVPYFPFQVNSSIGSILKLLVLKPQLSDFSQNLVYLTEVLLLLVVDKLEIFGVDNTFLLGCFF